MCVRCLLHLLVSRTSCPPLYTPGPQEHTAGICWGKPRMPEMDHQGVSITFFKPVSYTQKCQRQKSNQNSKKARCQAFRQAREAGTVETMVEGEGREWLSQRGGASEAHPENASQLLQVSKWERPRIDGGCSIPTAGNWWWHPIPSNGERLAWPPPFVTSSGP